MTEQELKECIAEVKYSDIPEEYFLPTPPEVDSNYMANKERGCVAG